MVLDVKSVDRLLGTPVPYAYAIKAGPWIFLTGHEAYDWETGTSAEVTGPTGFPLHGRQRSRREGDFILRRMRRVLGEFGSDLSHAIRLDQLFAASRLTPSISANRSSRLMPLTTHSSRAETAASAGRFNAVAPGRPKPLS